MSNIQDSINGIHEKLSRVLFRGPDYLGIEKFGNITIGHLRLKIIDVDDRSNQPYSFENLHMTYNGEIYNYLSLRKELELLGHKFQTKGDTEVLLKGYYSWGVKVLEKLNGMFSFAIFDSKNGEVFCARDRLGVKPFYYYWSQGDFEVSSQVNVIKDRSNKICAEAMSAFLDCGYVPSPLSIFEDIYKLPAGCYMKINLKNRSNQIIQYWDLNAVQENFQLTYNEAKDKLHELIIDSVRIRMNADVPMAFFLSGGVDSSLVSSIAAKYSNVPIQTFTIGFEDRNIDESEASMDISKLINSHHKVKICSVNDLLRLLPEFVGAFDEPFADSSAIPSLLLNREVSKSATVAFSGDGGDESFFGYLNFDMMDKFQKVMRVPLKLRKILGVFPWHRLFQGRPETIKSILNCADDKALTWKLFTDFDSVNLDDGLNWRGCFSRYLQLSSNPKQRMADFNIKLWLENDSNVKVDRSSMAYSVEVRSPFLDYRIIEFARTLPESFRYSSGNKKRILKDILSEYLPSEIINRPKRGFEIPISRWLKNELKADVHSKLTDNFLSKISHLDVVKFKKKFNDFYKGRYNYSHLVWRLYVLALWYEQNEN